jgi:hypothetical protein
MLRKACKAHGRLGQTVLIKINANNSKRHGVNTMPFAIFLKEVRRESFWDTAEGQNKKA